MQKRSRWISILVIIMGTGLLLWNAIREEEQAERRRAAKRFTETAILFREDDGWLLDCYPAGIGEDFLFDLRETERCMDFDTKEFLSGAEVVVVEDGMPRREELKKLEEMSEETGKASGTYRVKVQLLFPETEEERILEYLMLEYNGHYGVFGIHAEGMACYLWEERDKILLEKVFVRSNGDISCREEYRYDDGGKLDMIIVHAGFNDNSRKMYECEYDSAGRLTREDFYDGREKREVRYEYEDDGFGKQRGEKQYEFKYEAIYDDAENRYWECVGGGLKSVIKYDGNGNLMDEIIYGDDENVISRWIYKYDEEGRRTESDCWCYRDGRVWRRERYDSEEYLVDEIRYDSDGGRIRRDRYEYNRFGIMTRSISYDDDTREEVEYDSVGNVLIETHYTYGGKKVRSIEYKYTYVEEYDAKGKLIRKNGYDEKGKLVYVCEYDEAGHVAKETGYDKKRVVLHKYEYDSFGNLMLEVHHNRDKSYNAQEYDGRGVLKREYCYNYEGYKEYKAITEREYDAWGNVVRESEYVKDVKVNGYEEYKRMMHIWYEISRAWAGAPSDGCGSRGKDMAREYHTAEIPDTIEVQENMGVEISYYGDGTICGLSRYEYDEAGNLTGKKLYFRDGTELARYEWEYDEYGNRITEHYFNRKWEEEEQRRKWEYDDAENMVLEYNDVDKSRIEYEYDGDGNLIRETDCGGRCWEYEYEFDEAGRMIECREKFLFYDLHGSHQHGFIRKYEYDDDGNMIGEAYYEQGIPSYRYEYEYDTEGRRIGMAVYGFDLWGGKEEMEYRYEYRYDDMGKKAKETVYRTDGSVHMYTEYIGIMHDI